MGAVLTRPDRLFDTAVSGRRRVGAVPSVPPGAGAPGVGSGGIRRLSLTGGVGAARRPRRLSRPGPRRISAPGTLTGGSALRPRTSRRFG